MREQVSAMKISTIIVTKSCLNVEEKNIFLYETGFFFPLWVGNGKARWRMQKGYALTTRAFHTNSRARTEWEERYYNSLRDDISVVLWAAGLLTTWVRDGTLKSELRHRMGAWRGEIKMHEIHLYQMRQRNSVLIWAYFSKVQLKFWKNVKESNEAYDRVIKQRRIGRDLWTHSGQCRANHSITRDNHIFGFASNVSYVKPSTPFISRLD